MKKLDEINSVNDLSLADYLEYKSMLEISKTKTIGKKELIYLAPMLVALASFGLLAISTAFLFFSVPALCFGWLFALAAAQSIYLNLCKRADGKAKIKEYRRLKKLKKLTKIANLFAEFEKTDNFAKENLLFEISSLKQNIENCKKSNNSKNKAIELLEQELAEKEYLLGQINKQVLPAVKKAEILSAPEKNIKTIG